MGTKGGSIPIGRTLQIRDVLGHQLLHGDWAADDSHSVDIASLAYGQYLLSVVGGKEVVPARLERM